MNGAEMRVALYRLGLTIPALSRLTGWDHRTLTRQSTGEIAVSARTVEKIHELERAAAADLARYEDAAERGIPIHIPRLNTSQGEGELPPHWWTAIAARCQEKWGENVQVEWM